MEIDASRVSEMLVGLADVDVLGADDSPGGPLVVAVAPREQRPRCGGCGVEARGKEHRMVDLCDSASFGRCVVLWVRRTRWCCSDHKCGVGSWTVEHPEIAPARHALTTRAGRWATERVGRCGRSVSDVAGELGAGWHTVNNAVIAYGEALIDADTNRIGEVEAVSLDETLLGREGDRKHKRWSTQIVDARTAQLLDVVPGRDAAGPTRWLTQRPQGWLDGIRWAVMDMSGPYKAAYDTVLPDAAQVIDPFHVIRHANSKLDECRRRVQNETLGHRGRKADPLYRCRKLLLKASERLDPAGDTRLMGLLRAGDPHGEVAYSWHAKEATRFFYDIPDPAMAERYLGELSADLRHHEFPAEVTSLGRTLRRWHTQICNWHHAKATNGPAEAVNNLIKRVKRVAFGFRRFHNYRIRTLLYAGQPNWALLTTLKPR